MDTQKATYDVTRMARLLEVSRSGYYDWAAREAAGPTQAQQRRAQLTDKIRTFHKASDEVSGSPRITKREARLAVGAWIEDRYTRRRRHSSIGMLSPVRYENSLTQTATAA